MNVNGWRNRGQPKEKWMDCLKDDVTDKGVDHVVGKGVDEGGILTG